MEEKVLNITNASIKRIANFLANQEMFYCVTLQRCFYTNYPLARHIVDDMQKLSLIKPFGERGFQCVDKDKFVEYFMILFPQKDLYVKQIKDNIKDLSIEEKIEEFSYCCDISFQTIASLFKINEMEAKKIFLESFYKGYLTSNDTFEYEEQDESFDEDDRYILTMSCEAIYKHEFRELLRKAIE